MSIAYAYMPLRRSRAGGQGGGHCPAKTRWLTAPKSSDQIHMTINDLGARPGCCREEVSAAGAIALAERPLVMFNGRIMRRLDVDSDAGGRSHDVFHEPCMV